MMQTKQIDLAVLTVRPVRDAAEQAEWGRLMNKHHYLGFRSMVGGGLRHVAQTPADANIHITPLTKYLIPQSIRPMP